MATEEAGSGGARAGREGAGQKWKVQGDKSAQPAETSGHLVPAY